MRMIYVFVLLVVRNNVNVNAKIHLLTIGNVKVTATFGNFKRHHKMTIAFGELIGYSVHSRKECGRACIDHDHCNGFVLTRNYKNPPLSCRLFKGNLDTNHYHAKQSEDEDFYEIQNPCTLNPGICEHGSVCIPHFHNNSYYCDWCQQPFYGKHCNETESEEVEDAHHDIISGRNSSCRQLVKNYAIPGGTYEIHPWKDWRKIKVFCYKDGGMLLMQRGEDPSKPNHAILNSGIQLTGEFTVTTSFVNSLYKLIKFQQIIWRCRKQGESNKQIVLWSFHSADHLNVFRYVIGESDIVYSACNIFDNIDCGLLVGQTFSNLNVNDQKRLYAGVLQYNNGDRLTVDNLNFGCFGPMADIESGDSFVVLVL